MEKIHELKLRHEYWDAVMSGEKSFEVRYDDRGFQKGDKVIFTKLDDIGASTVTKSPEFKINFVLHGWGLKENWVAFSITPI